MLSANLTNNENTIYLLGTIKEQFTYGANWLPEFASYCVLFNSVDKLCCTLLYPKNSEKNEHYARCMIDNIINLAENMDEKKNILLSEFISVEE